MPRGCNNSVGTKALSGTRALVVSPATWLQILTVVLILVLHPICDLEAQGGANPSSQEVVRRIGQILQQHDFQKTLEECNAEIRSDPRNPRLWTLRGMAYFGLGNDAAALDSYEDALKFAPSFLPALEGVAQLKYKQGSDGARPFLLRILAERPDDPTTHAMLGVLDYQQKNCSQAVHFHAAGLAIAAQPVALGQYGTCLAMLQRFNEAIPVLRNALALDPARTNTRYNLALSQWNANQPSDARRDRPVAHGNPG